jgi:hypothetical protein
MEPNMAIGEMLPALNLRVQNAVVPGHISGIVLLVFRG